MATVAELKSIATDLKLSFKSKATKGELEQMIAAKREELAEQSNRAFVEANSVPIPMFVQIRQGLARPKAPRNVPLSSEQREDRYKVSGRKNLTKKQAKRLRKKANRNG